MWPSRKRALCSETWSFSGGTQEPVERDRHESLISTGSEEPWRGARELLRKCKERSQQKRAPWRYEWQAVQLGLGERTRWQAGFPRKTSNRSIYSQEFWNHIDLGSSLSSTLESCGTWGKSLRLSEPRYPAHRAVGGFDELNVFYPKPRT